LFTNAASHLKRTENPFHIASKNLKTLTAVVGGKPFFPYEIDKNTFRDVKKLLLKKVFGFVCLEDMSSIIQQFYSGLVTFITV